MTEKRSILLAYVALLYGTFMLFSLLSSFFGYETDQWSFFYYYSFQINILVTSWLLLYSISVFRGLQKLYDFVTLRVVMTSLARLHGSGVFDCYLYFRTCVIWTMDSACGRTSTVLTHHNTDGDVDVLLLDSRPR
jgi:hypothetical protein